MRRIVDRTFVVAAPLQTAWDHLAEVEKWPSWAKHIRSVAKSPPGPLSLESRGTLTLSNGIKTTFVMTEFEPVRHWKWVGSFLGSTIYYDHLFEQREPAKTSIRFTVDVAGWSVRSVPFLRGIFGWIYRRNLERAIPLLVKEVETAALGP